METERYRLASGHSIEELILIGCMHQPRGPLGSRMISGKKLPQRQLEVIGACRGLYCLDKEVWVLWVTYVLLQHP